MSLTLGATLILDSIEGGMRIVSTRHRNVLEGFYMASTKRRAITPHVKRCRCEFRTRLWADIIDTQAPQLRMVGRIERQYHISTSCRFLVHEEERNTESAVWNFVYTFLKGLIY